MGMGSESAAGRWLVRRAHGRVEEAQGAAVHAGRPPSRPPGANSSPLPMTHDRGSDAKGQGHDDGLNSHSARLLVPCCHPGISARPPRSRTDAEGAVRAPHGRLRACSRESARA